MLVAAALPPGTLLGGWRVERALGRGRIGGVYRAVNAAGGPPVALKVLPWAASAGSGPFGRELASARRLRHPDIVDIVDVGEVPGLGWLAMTLAPGHDLQRHADADALLPPATIAEIGARVAAALAHAHRHGVVHRDVKPANVLVDLDSASVRLTDFGIARIASGAAGGGAAGSHSATRSGLLLGTVAFMSPEQLSGANVDAASDLYSLGAMLFQLLTGRLPHEAESLSRQMFAIANTPAPDARALRPDLGAPLAALLARLLAKAPAARGSDGDALAAELREAAQTLPISGALPVGGGESPADPRHNSPQ